MNLQAIKRGNLDLGIGISLIDNRELCEQNRSSVIHENYIEALAIIRGFLMAENERLLTASEIADVFQISRDEIYRLARRGIIPSHKIGGVWRFSLVDVKSQTAQLRDKENGQHS